MTGVISTHLNGFVTQVRSLDASFARDQRRMLAEAEALRGQLAQRTEETRELRALQHCEQERSLRTREEAEAIVEAVKKERASQAWCFTASMVCGLWVQAGRLKEAEATSSAAQELTQRLQEQLDQVGLGLRVWLQPGAGGGVPTGRGEAQLHQADVSGVLARSPTRILLGVLHSELAEAQAKGAELAQDAWVSGPRGVGRRKRSGSAPIKSRCSR